MPHDLPIKKMRMIGGKSADHRFATDLNRPPRGSTIFTFAQLPERNREFGRFDCVLRALARRGSEHFGSVVGDV